VTRFLKEKPRRARLAEQAAEVPNGFLARGELYVLRRDDDVTCNMDE
jgi:hypothetical protein